MSDPIKTARDALAGPLAAYAHLSEPVQRNLAVSVNLWALRQALADLTPFTPPPEAERERRLVEVLRQCDGEEAHRILPSIWPILCEMNQAYPRALSETPVEEETR